MRKYVGIFALACMFITGCSDKQTPYIEVEPVQPALSGTWGVDNVIGLDAIDFMAGYRPYQDTMLIGDDGKYYFVNQGDTTDFGDFAFGQSQAVNGFGRVQSYDSIVYHSTRSIATDAPAPLVYYYQLSTDRLSVSLSYFKDSADYKFIINYIRR